MSRPCGRAVPALYHLKTVAKSFVSVNIKPKSESLSRKLARNRLILSPPSSLSPILSEEFGMPGRNPNPNPNPKPAATSRKGKEKVDRKANQKPKATKGAKEEEKEKEKEKNIDLREVDLCKLWGLSFSEDSFVKPNPDPDPEENGGDEVVRSILGWDKDIWEKEMEIEKGMKVKEGKDLYYDDDEQLEFDNRRARYFN